MSSEGSVSTSSSSRIHQFGLYKTIDARTEEFLRLSRKRQLKQGCACAAISTAITVTIVITIFFVYMEYGLNTDANQQSIGKAGWIGFLNDSLASSFEEKFSKSKIHFDSNTIKLLPILIKALKHNRYLEKIIEDYSSSSPTYDGKMTTEFSLKKDIFLNTKNWIKKPFSRLYTIEYKTSPIVFLRNPTRKPGYFTKNRKIREYKRIMDYVEKMINDKVGVGFTVPMTNKKLDSHTDKLTEKPNVASNYLSKAKLIKKSRSPKRNSKMLKQNQDEVVSCKCPKQLGVILDKIFNSIHQLLPDDKIIKPRPCSGDQKSDTSEASLEVAVYRPKIEIASTTISTTSTTTKKDANKILQFSEFDNIYRKDDTIIPLENMSLQKVQENFVNNYKNNKKIEGINQLNNKDTYNFPEPFQTLTPTTVPIEDYKLVIDKNDNKTLPSFWIKRLFSPDFIVQATATFDHIQPTEGKHNIKPSTQPMQLTLDFMENEMERDQIDNPALVIENKLASEDDESNMSQTNYVNLISDKISENMNINSKISNFTHPFHLENENAAHVTTDTIATVLDKMNKFNFHSIELLKSNILPPIKRLNATAENSVSSVIDKEYSTTESMIKDFITTHPLQTPQNEDSTTKSVTTESSIEDSTVKFSYRIADVTKKPIIITPTHFSFSPKNLTNEERAETNKLSKMSERHRVESSFTSNNKTATRNDTKNVTLEHLKNIQEPFYWSLDNITLEDEIEKMSQNEEYQEELKPKIVESGSANKKNSTSKIQDFLQNFYGNEGIFRSNSMIPHSRPTYLEIHRNANDWKPEENKDYDTDMKYNIFDLL